MQPILHRSLAEEAQAAVLAHISSAGLGIGDTLPSEKELAQRLELSRSSLREGLARLRQHEVISTGRRRGMRLQRPRPFVSLAVFADAGADMTSHLEWCEMRLMFEVGAIREACARLTPDDLALLEDLCRGEQRASGDLDGLREIDQAFHTQLLRATGNRQAMDLAAALMQFFKTPTYDAAFAHWHRRGQQPRTDHRPLLDALRAHDPDRCSRVMHEHLVVHVQALRAQIAREREPTAPDTEPTAPDAHPDAEDR